MGGSPRVLFRPVTSLARLRPLNGFGGGLVKSSCRPGSIGGMKLAILLLLLGALVVSFISVVQVGAADAPTTTPRIEWVAHRGESHDAPENTMAAYKLAWERGVTAAELDVHLTKDGKLILIHDADTQRTAGQKLIVKESTVEQLQKLDVGSWKDPKYAGEKMPLLEDVLATIPDGARMFVEVKIGAEAVPELIRVIKKVGKKPEQTPVISFKLDTCIETKKAIPELKVYYLASQKQDKKTMEWKPTNQELIALAKQHRFDGLDLSYKGPIDAEFVRAVKAAGLAFYVWTIDDPAEAKRMIDLGVEAITSNRPAWLAEQFKK